MEVAFFIDTYQKGDNMYNLIVKGIYEKRKAEYMQVDLWNEHGVLADIEEVNNDEQIDKPLKTMQ